MPADTKPSVVVGSTFKSSLSSSCKMNCDAMVNAILQSVHIAIVYGRTALCHRGRCESLVALLRILESLAEELLDNSVDGLEATYKQLQEVVGESKKLLLDCKSRSRLYMILKRDTVVEKFSEIASSLENSAQAVLDASSSKVLLAETLARDARTLRFTATADVADKRLCEEINAIMNIQKEGREVAPEQLCELAKALDLGSEAEIEAEKARLDEDREDANADCNYKEVTFIHDIFTLILSMQAAQMSSTTISPHLRARMLAEPSARETSMAPPPLSAVWASRQSLAPVGQGHETEAGIMVRDNISTGLRQGRETEAGRQAREVVSPRSREVMHRAASEGMMRGSLRSPGGRGQEIEAGMQAREDISPGSNEVMHRAASESALRGVGSVSPVVIPLRGGEGGVSSAPTRLSAVHEIPPEGRPIYPTGFLCPLSLGLMADPVLVSTGITYERVFIQHWLEQGKRHCPKTRQKLSSTELLPNASLRTLIRNWCVEHHVPLPEPKVFRAEEGVTEGVHRAHSADIWSSVSDRPTSPDNVVSASQSSPHSTNSLPAAGGHPPNRNLRDPGSRWLADERFGPFQDPAVPAEMLSEMSLSLRSWKGREESSNSGSGVGYSDSSTRSRRGSVGYNSDSSLKSQRGRDVLWSPGNRPGIEDGIGMRNMSGSRSRDEVRTVTAQQNRSASAVHGNNWDDARVRRLSAGEFSGRPDNSDGSHRTRSPVWEGPPLHNQLNASGVSLGSQRPFPPDSPARGGRVVSPTSETASIKHGLGGEDSFAVSGITSFSGEGLAVSFHSEGPSGDATSGLEIAMVVNKLHHGSPEERRSAAWEVRQLARSDSQKRKEIAEAGAIKPLIKLLSSSDLATMENAAAAIHNLSIDEGNKALLLDSMVIDPIVHVLMTGNNKAKEAAAATLASLALVNENKVVIGVLGAIPPLVHLLINGHPEGKKDALLALLQLSIYHGNKKKIVKAGAVPPLIEIVEEGVPGILDRTLQVLGQLATIPEGRESISKSEGISPIVDILEDGSERGKEEAAAILLLLCQNSKEDLVAALNSGPIPALNKLSYAGTHRARRKATELLKIMREHSHG